jgi:hypothetical protein
LLSLALAVLVLAGCGENGIKITGNATLDREPVESGSIAFIPDDGKGPTVGGGVEAGKFTVTGLTPGKKRVQLTMSAAGEAKQSNQRQRMQEMKDQRQAAKANKSQRKPPSKQPKVSELVVEITSNMAPLTLEFKTLTTGR